MSGALSVALHPELHAGFLLSVIASLPCSVRLTATNAADIVLVDGSARWPEISLALIGERSHAIMVIDPGPADAAAIARLADAALRRDVAVHLSEGFADNPGIAGFRSSLSGKGGHVTVHGSSAASPQSLLMQQLRLARAAGFAAHLAVDACHTAHAVIATFQNMPGERTGLLRMTAARSPAVTAQYRLQVHRPDLTASLLVYDGWTARPARAEISTTDGMSSLPDQYESAHRSRLRAIARGSGGDWRRRLGEFGADLRLALRACPSA